MGHEWPWDVSMCVVDDKGHEHVVVGIGYEHVEEAIRHEHVVLLHVYIFDRKRLRCCKDMLFCVIDKT